MVRSSVGALQNGRKVYGREQEKMRRRDEEREKTKTGEGEEERKGISRCYAKNVPRYAVYAVVVCGVVRGSNSKNNACMLESSTLRCSTYPVQAW